MYKRLLICVLTLLLAVSAGAQARNALGISISTYGLAPMALMGLSDGYAIGVEVDPSVAYIGLIGRHYEHNDFHGTFAGLVVGSVSSYKAPYGLSVIRLQGGYSFRLENSSRLAVGLSYDSGPHGYSALGLLAEAKLLF